MSQIAFFIDSFRIYWFGILIAASILISIVIALLCRRMQRRDLRSVFFVGVIGGLLSLCFARLIHWYCCSGQYESFTTAVTDLKNGGFSIFGVFLGCTLAVLLAGYLDVEDKISELFDCIAPAGALGICIGRLGSFFTTSDRGKQIITNPLFQRLPFSVQMAEESGGEWQFATFVFESIAAFIAFIIVMRVFSAIYVNRSRNSRPRPGDAALIFVAFYGATQAVLESTRYDALFLRSNGFVSLMQVVSSISLVVVLIVFSVRAVRRTGMQPRYPVLWIVSLLLVGVAMLFEYLVQRYGDLSLYFYFGMLSCMLCVFCITWVLYRMSIEIPECDCRPARVYR